MVSEPTLPRPPPTTMAEKPVVQTYDAALSTMENQLSTIEEAQISTQDQITALHTGFNQLNLDNVEMKLSLRKITDFLEKDLHNSIKEAIRGTTQPLRDTEIHHQTVSASPHTPTNFATFGDSNFHSELHKSRSVNWEGNPRNPVPQNLDMNARLVDLQSLPELHTILNTKVPILTQPPENPPLFTQPMASTLNPHALPVYPPFSINPITAPYLQPTMPPPTIPMTSNPPYTGPINSSVPNWGVPNNPPYKGANPSFRTPKIDFPKFSGNDPRGWLNKCEKFFQLNNTNDLRARVLCAALYMEGEADIWFRTIEKERPTILWPEFAILVCKRFSKLGYENVVGQFNKLTQKGKVEEYIGQFDELRNYVMAEEGCLRESHYVDNFISGLKEEIAQYLYNHKPQTLQQARDMARGQEYFLSVLDKRYKSSTPSSKYNSLQPYSKWSPTAKSTTDATTTVPITKPATEGFRKLSLAEITEKKKLGLCFHCDQKYVPGHDCRKKKLFMIMEEGSAPDEVSEEDIPIMWEE